MNSEQYKTQDFFISTESLDVSEGYPGSLVIQLTVDDVSTIRMPRLFYRKSDNTALLRLNFSTYYPVTVPEYFVNDIKKAKNVDLIISVSSTSRTTIKPAIVSPVWQFPDIYEINRHPEEVPETQDAPSADNCAVAVPEDEAEEDNEEEMEENEPDGDDADVEEFEFDFHFDDDEDEDEREDGEEDHTAPPEKNSSEMNEDFEHLSCREIIRQWTAECQNISVYFRECGDINFCLITDKRSRIRLVSLFEHDNYWLADEQVFCGFPPLYFSEIDHVVSPVFAASAVVDHLQCCTGMRISAAALFDDAATVINSDEVDEEYWHWNEVKVCCGNRDYQCRNIMEFDNCMNYWFYCGNDKFTPAQIATLIDEFNKLDESNIDTVYNTSMRVDKLLYGTCGNSGIADSMKAWFTGNYTENILLGRYRDRESGYFFNLVYNWSNTAIILEYSKMKQGANPVDSVLAIREKLQKSGTVSALVPCIVSGKAYDGAIPDGVKYYLDTDFFALEKYSFSREMGFDKLPEVPQSDVEKLVREADGIFQRSCKPEAEKYTPENERFMLETLQHIEGAFSRKKLHTVYDSTLFERSIWTMVIQNEGRRTVIIFKEAGAKEFENRKEEFEKAVFIDENHIFKNTEIVTVVIVPEEIAQNREESIYGNKSLFYTGIDKFADQVCRIIINC